MKKLHVAFVALVLFGVSALNAQTQAGFKLLTIDMNKLFEGYPGTAMFRVEMAASQKAAQSGLELLFKQGNALVDSYKTLVDQAKTATASADRVKFEAMAEGKMKDIQAKQAEVESYKKEQEERLKTQQEAYKNETLKKISAIAAGVAKRKGATALVDTAGITAIGISNFVYTDPTIDITDEVLAEINATPAAKPASP